MIFKSKLILDKPHFEVVIRAATVQLYDSTLVAKRGELPKGAANLGRLHRLYSVGRSADEEQKTTKRHEGESGKSDDDCRAHRRLTIENQRRRTSV